MSTILVVDDNEDIRNLLINQMKVHGFTVATAGNGVEAVEIAASIKPALILMDINLPELDGLEATMRIREADADSRIPVIALTAYALPDDEARARAAGCDAFHAKPVDFKKLFVEIRELIDVAHEDQERQPH